MLYLMYTGARLFHSSDIIYILLLDPPERTGAGVRVRGVLFYPIKMKQAIGNHIYNTDRCIVHRHSLKVTEDVLTPRVKFRKEEVLCHQKQDSKGYFNWVKAYKYIDGVQVAFFQWIQEVDDDEIKDFLQRELTVREPTEADSKRERKKLFHRKYYLEHKEELIEKRKQYYRQHGR